MDNTSAVTTERRRDARLELRIPVLLFSGGSENPVRTETVNISKTGFYCATKEPFAPGDRLRCLFSISSPGDSADSDLYLDAEIEVMRVLVDTSGFGLGCRIGEYHIVSQQAVRLPIRELMHA